MDRILTAPKRRPRPSGCHAQRSTSSCDRTSWAPSPLVVLAASLVPPSRTSLPGRREAGSTVTPTLEAALEYAAHGWPVFVLGPSKRPLACCASCTDHRGDVEQMEACDCLTCHSFYAATTEAKRIIAMTRSHPRGNLAVRTGRASGLVVVDVDPRSGGLDTLADLDRARSLPGTVIAITGSGGLHLYYRHPGGHLPSRAGAFGSGVDCKADGGYAVLPPSVHPTTRARYRWSGGGWQYPLPNLPNPLARMASPAQEKPLGRDRRPIGVDMSSPHHRLTRVVRVVLEAPQGQRNNTLYWAAQRTIEMQDEGWLSPRQAEAALHRAGANIGLPPREIASIVASAGRRKGAG